MSDTNAPEATFSSVRESIELMMARPLCGDREADRWHVPKVAGDKALAMLSKLEAGGHACPKILTEDDGMAFTWELPQCKIYQHFNTDAEMDGHHVIWRHAPPTPACTATDGPPAIKHPRSGTELPTEVFADPGRRGWYFRERQPDSVARYVRDDLDTPSPQRHPLLRTAADQERG